MIQTLQADVTFPRSLSDISTWKSGNESLEDVRFEDGTIQRVELHWDEAHGIGRKKLKIKEYLD
jgi:hypothetical protein